MTRRASVTSVTDGAEGCKLASYGRGCKADWAGGDSFTQRKARLGQGDGRSRDGIR